MILVTRPEPTVRPPSRIAKLEAFLHGDRVNEVASDLNVVARHNHLDALGQVSNTGNVGGAEVELRTIAVEERGVTATFILGKDVDLTHELSVRGDRAGLAENLATVDVLALDATEQADRRCRQPEPRRAACGTSRCQCRPCLEVSLMPTISSGSLTCRTPRSTRPVATVPRPVMVMVSSTAIRNGLSTSRSGVGM